MHRPWQAFVPERHVQVPPWQLWPVWHGLLQRPQCVLWLEVSVHTPLQRVLIWLGQMHWPPWQSCLVDALLQSAFVWQVVHWELTQDSPERQERPQPPQWLLSEDRSTHAPLHSLVPEGHTQAPLWHCLPPEQSPWLQQSVAGMHWPLQGFCWP